MAPSLCDMYSARQEGSGQISSRCLIYVKFGGEVVGRRNTAKNYTIPETVESYLRENPDCLAHRPDLLRTLTPPSRFNGQDGVADFQEAIIQGLRSDLDRMSQKSADILSLSQNNLSQQQRTHAATLLLLQAETPTDFHRVLTKEWPKLIGVDAIALVLEDDTMLEMYEGPSGIVRVPRGMIDGIFIGAKNPRVLLSDYRPGNKLFGALAHQIHSDALARIDAPAPWETPQSRCGKTPTGLLALGAFAPDTFHPEQATDLLEFLARLLGSTLTRWCAPTL